MKNLLLSLFAHRSLALIRWDIHFMRVRLLNLLFNRQRVVDAFIKRGGSKYLNLGSGPRGIDDENWLNIDGFPDKNVHYLCDFSRRIPIPPSTLDGVFTEHVLEHFDLANGRRLLEMCHVMLKEGGVIRIIVPDGHKILKWYFEDPESILRYRDCKSGCAIEAVNSWFYQRYEHQFIYDADMLGHLLREVGFSEVRQAGYKRTELGAGSLLLDDQKYEWESLYMEAMK
jgi:predicted SAM-dependent methyltransferase